MEMRLIELQHRSWAMLVDLVHGHLQLLSVLEAYEDQQLALFVSFDVLDFIHFGLPVGSLGHPHVVLLVFFFLAAFRGGGVVVRGLSAERLCRF
jgi:hypothetical protein